MTPPNLTVADLNVLRVIFTVAHLRGRVTNEHFATTLQAFDAAEHRLDDWHRRQAQRREPALAGAR